MKGSMMRGRLWEGGCHTTQHGRWCLVQRNARAIWCAEHHTVCGRCTRHHVVLLLDLCFCSCFVRRMLFHTHAINLFFVRAFLSSLPGQLSPPRTAGRQLPSPHHPALLIGNTIEPSLGLCNYHEVRVRGQSIAGKIYRFWVQGASVQRQGAPVSNTGDT